jgi:polysaccharide pyruvyl transferase CsaB
MSLRVGLLGYYGRGNIGDEAVLAGTLAGLRTLAPEAEPIVFSYDPPATQQEHGAAARQMKSVNTAAIAARLSGVDCLVLGGGGLLNDYRLSGLVFYAHWVAVASMLGRRVMLHAVGVGPLRTRTGRVLARWIARRCCSVSVRDEMSRGLLGRADALLGADAALLMAPPSPPRQPGRMATIIPRRWAEGFPRQGLAALADWLAGQGFEPVLLAMHPQLDLPALRAVRDQAARPVRVIEDLLTAQEAFALLGSAGLVISMRLHGVLFAAMQGVPVVGIAYDDKLSALLGELGCAGQSVSLGDATAPRLIDAAARTLAVREELSARLVSGCERLRARVQAAIALLHEFVKASAR